jgi:RNA polymerase sigma factor (sigma-70 family)
MKTSLRDKFILKNLNLARKVAHAHSRKCWEPYEDLEQVATIGLIKAADNFNPDLGAFSSYAIPKIDGEIKHYLRDKSLLKIPRSLHGELISISHLSIDSEIAQHSPTHEDDRIERTIDEIAILDEKYKQVLYLYYFKGLTTHRIAELLKISQMTAWRRLNRGLSMIRKKLEILWEPRSKCWGKEELAHLERLAEILPVSEIARRLNRSESSVRQKLNSLGYSCATQLDNYSILYLAKSLGASRSVVAGWIDSGSLKASRLSQRRWAVKAADFAQFCRNHPKLVAGFDRETLQWLTGGRIRRVG